MRGKWRVFICSPYGGSAEEIEHNRKIAHKLCNFAAIQYDYAPFAPHLMYPLFLDESDEDQRDIGIKCGLSFLSMCSEMWVYLDSTKEGDISEQITYGMLTEIEHAMDAGVAIYVMNQDLKRSLFLVDLAYRARCRLKFY